ncbi:hypothetical protein ACLMJK_000613 [Lecanora helva]
MNIPPPKYYNALTTGKPADCKLACNDVQHSEVHKIVICKSPVFKTLVDNLMGSLDNVIRVNDMEPFYLSVLVEFLYHDKYAQYDLDTHTRMYQIGCSYELPTLWNYALRECEKFVHDNIQHASQDFDSKTARDLLRTIPVIYNTNSVQDRARKDFAVRTSVNSLDLFRSDTVRRSFQKTLRTVPEFYSDLESQLPQENR